MTTTTKAAIKATTTESPIDNVLHGQSGDLTMKPLAGAEVSDFGTRFGFEAAGSKNSEPEALADSTEKSASASGSRPWDEQDVCFCSPA